MTQIALLFLIDEIDDVLILFKKFKTQRSERMLFALQTKLTQLYDLFHYQNNQGEDRFIIENHEYFVDIFNIFTSLQPDTKLDEQQLKEIDNKMLGLTMIKVSRQNETVLHHHSTIKNALDTHAVVSRTDLNGTITSVNQKFIDITGYTREQLIGNNHRVLKSRQQAPDFFVDMWATISNGKPWSGIICNRRKGGELYWVETSIMPQFNVAGKINGYISIRTDITDTVLVQKEVEKSLKIAEQASQAKSQFLTSMTHELRTPLNSIIGYSQLLERSELTNKQLDQVKNIKNSGEYLLGLINEILDLSSIEAGKFSVNLKPVNLTKAIEDAIAITLPSAGQRAIKINSNLAAIDADLTVLADPTRLPQVLLNFLSNAVKYNRDNGEVLIKVEQISSQPGLVTDLKITIQDTGVGIPAEMQSKVFESFNRLGHEASNVEGTGVGLSITKNLIEMMRGQVGFSSEENIGTSFWFQLPVPKNQGLEQVLEAANPENSQKLSKKTNLDILYIEDDPLAMELMEDMFDQIGQHNLYISPTAEHGIGQAKTLTPDIIMLDLNLPDITGNHLVKILRQMPNIIEHQTKIYAVTSEDPATSELLNSPNDFDFIVQKPFQSQTLINILSEQT